MGKEQQNLQNASAKTPGGQGILDNIWLLIGLGLGLPFIVYMAWAVLELVRLPNVP